MRNAVWSLCLVGMLAGCEDGSACFTGATPVATPSGWRAISALRVGDVVSSFDLARRVVVPGYVTATFRHEARPVHDLQIDGRRLGVTPNHPIYSHRQRRFVRADALEAHDAVLALDGRQQHIGRVKRAPAFREHDVVYNITVAPFPHYFANGVLVHNKTRPDIAVRVDISNVVALQPFKEDIAIPVGRTATIRVGLSRPLKDSETFTIVAATDASSIEVSPPEQTLGAPVADATFLVKRTGAAEGTQSVKFTLSNGSSQTLTVR